MSLFILALNTLTSNSFASEQFSEETEGELGNSNSVIIDTETRALNFKDIFKNGIKVENNDTINILDVDLQDKTKFNYLTTILENKNIFVNLLITPNSPFLNDGVLSIAADDDLPRNLKHLSIKDKGGLVIQIGSFFLSGCENLTSFDSRGLENVTQIESGFLGDCKNLISFDSKGLENVTKIRDWFLFGCKSLTSFDARILENVIQIGSFFLSECSFTSFDARKLENVIQIGFFFLSGSDKLKEIITTESKASFWKENLPENIKKKINLVIQNEDKYNDIEERVDYVQKNYAQEMSGLIHRHDNGFIQIKTSNALLLL